MLWNLEDLLRHIRSNSVKIDGTYMPARPLPGPTLWRLRAAWAVLRGKADAFTWPGGQ